MTEQQGLFLLVAFLGIAVTAFVMGWVARGDE